MQSLSYRVQPVDTAGSDRKARGTVTGEIERERGEREREWGAFRRGKGGKEREREGLGGVGLSLAVCELMVSTLFLISSPKLS